MASKAVQQGKQMIESRRRAENAYLEMERVAAETRKIHQYTNFEITTTDKIDRRMKQQMFEAKKKEYEDNLHQRRKRLAALYNDEMEQWKAEVVSRVETTEDRKRRIMERAYALRDAREKARNDYVKKRLDDQWRDSCDDARTLDSKAMLLFMNQERLRQIEEKRQRKQMLSKQEDSFLAEWNRQLDELARRDAEKEEYRRKIDKETSQAIRQQIEANERMKEEYYRSLRKEEDEELERLRKEIEDDEAEQRKRLEQAHARGREVMEFNLEYQQMRKEEEAIEREHDAILLDYALRKEREQIEAEELKKNANRHAAMQYRKYLEEQMIKEAEDTAFVDEIRRQEEEKVWKARDDALKAREDARAHLMQLVDEGRQEQIRYKYEQLAKEKAHDTVFVKKFMEDAAEAVRQEREETERRRRLAMENNVELNKQIALRRHKEELEKQEQYLSDKQMKYRERLHQQKLAEQAGSVRLSYPLQKNNWYT